MPLFVFTARMLDRDPVFVTARGGVLRAMIDHLEIGRIVPSPSRPGQWDWSIHCCLSTTEAIDLAGSAATADLACAGLVGALHGWVRDNATLAIRSVPVPLRRPVRHPRLPR